MSGISLNSTKSRSAADPTNSSLPSAGMRYCAEMWQRLSRIGTHVQAIVTPSEIGSDPADIICPKRTAIVVDVGIAKDGKKSSIHANVIKFVRENFLSRENASTPGATKKVVAGQSPKTFEQTEKVVIQALDSGNGLVQLVSSEAERARQIHSKKTVIEQLLIEKERCGRLNTPFMLAERYEVMGLADITGDMLSDCRSQNDHRVFLLTAADRHNNGQTKTVPITQAGFDFSDHLLSAAKIEEANLLIAEHLRVRNEVSVPASVGMIEPNIISHAGVGRNAALITYREVLARIDEGLPEQQLDDALEEVVAQGRRDRGPKFLSSEPQLEEVRLALSEMIHKRDHAHAASRLALPFPSRRQDFFAVENKEVADSAGSSKLLGCLDDDAAKDVTAAMPLAASPPPLSTLTEIRRPMKSKKVPKRNVL